MKRGWSMLIVLFMCVLCCGAWAEEVAPVTVEEHRADGAMESYVRCPVFTVHDDEALSAALNGTVQEKAGIGDYLQALSMISDGSTGLKVDYLLTDVTKPVVSLVFSADGKMLTGRPSQKYIPMVLDLETGVEITAQDVFTDVYETEMFLEAYLEDEVAPLLSMHMENSDLLPVPMEQFGLNELGVTFYYDVKQLSFLSGYAGAVTVPYHELEAFLDLSDGSALKRMGYAEKMLYIDEYTAQAIEEKALSGMLGALPAVVGMELDNAITTFRCTIDAGFYPGGAYYEMEDADLRDAVLLTDEQETRVTGILAKRLSLYGLKSGVSTREAWQNVLGEADFTMEMGESDGGQYMLCAGISDYYDFGVYTLQLHADEYGVLYAAVLHE